MFHIFLLALVIVLGYFIPVAASLAFSLTMGERQSGRVARRSRLLPSFLLLHGLVWTIAAALSGFLAALFAGPLAWPIAYAIATLLVVMLWVNRTHMRKLQGPIQLGGMTFASIAGTMLGCFLYLHVL